MTEMTFREKIARAMRTYEVQGVVYADDAGSAYRVVSGVTVFGGDHVDLASAQAECDRLNADAVLDAMADPSMGVLQAGYEAMFIDKWDGTQAPMMGAGYDAMITAAKEET